MFLVSLNRALRSKNWFNAKDINEPNLIDYLDLVSLGTVCDVVPLVGLNRAIVKQGLKVIKSKKNLGLKTLLDICKIESNPSIYHLGYLLGPRINAGGRVGKCSHGANLLLNKDPKNTFKIASELDQYNKERQILEKDLLQKILNKNLQDKVSINETEMMGKFFLVTDPIENMSWKMTGESKKIGQYTCYKATYEKEVTERVFSFGSQNQNQNNMQTKTVEVSAWFTPEIPISNGPGLYQGLPGLILEWILFKPQY